MDSRQAFDIIMDGASDWSDIDESESDMDVSDGEENEDFALPGSTDGTKDSDGDSIPPTTLQQPGPSQFREMRKNYVSYKSISICGIYYHRYKGFIHHTLLESLKRES